MQNHLRYCFIHMLHQFILCFLLYLINSVLVEDLVGLRQNVLFGALRYDCDLPDLVKRAPIGLLMGMQQLFTSALDRAEITCKPSLMDLQPKMASFAQKRLNIVFSGILNFKKFFVEVDPILNKICLEEEQRLIREQADKEELYDVQEQLQREKEHRAIQDAKADSLFTDIAALRQLFEEEDKQTSKMLSFSQQQERVVDQLREEEAEIKAEQSRMCREMEYLQQKVVESPEALQQEISHLDARVSEVGEQLGRQYLRLSELDQAAKDHKYIMAFITDVQQELQLIKELREEHQVSEEEFARVKSSTSGYRVDASELHRQEIMGQRQLVDITDRISRNVVLVCIKLLCLYIFKMDNNYFRKGSVLTLIARQWLWWNRTVQKFYQSWSC